MRISDSSWLNLNRKDVHSQNGEDGVLEAIFDRIGVRTWWCCELGAHDGITNSNTYNLRKNHGWTGVLIESDASLIPALQENSRENDIVAHAHVDEVNSLDRILLQTMIPKSFDLLSIDVDGEDQNIWRSLEHYTPRVVVIEVDSRISPDSEQGFLLHPSGISGCVAIGKAKGYELALHTGNCIFVQHEFVRTLGIDTKNWEALFDTSWLEKPYA